MRAVGELGEPGGLGRGAEGGWQPRQAWMRQRMCQEKCLGQGVMLGAAEVGAWEVEVN